VRGESAIATWRDLRVEGQVIFCEIDKAIRFADSVIVDVTTLNFNLLFEIGFAIGLNKAVLPIRDTTVATSRREFAALGILDSVGYLDFHNADELSQRLDSNLPASPLPPLPSKLSIDRPLYVLKGPIDSEGAIRLMSAIKKSPLNFRSYDQDESSRLSLNEARRQVAASLGVVAHLLHPERDGATAHNALAALVCGMALAEQKVVVMLQEEFVDGIIQPLDYRDLVLSYRRPEQIKDLLEPRFRRVVEALQKHRQRHAQPPETPLEAIELGDPAAENEITGLEDYFVRTAQYRRALQGQPRIVVGRKGSGKTAIFYAVRGQVKGGHARVVLDLRPEGHQFKKLREAVLSSLPEGLAEHTIAAFWHYILLCELAHKVLEADVHHAERDHHRHERYLRLEAAYFQHRLSYGDDFSQRLLRQVERLIERYDAVDRTRLNRDGLTELLYAGDIRELDTAVADYLSEKESVWLLIDNLDKGWPIRGASPADILIIRTLLVAARKLQDQLASREVAFRCLVFLRSDIYEELVLQTPDKGKETPVSLDLQDPQTLRDILLRRLQTSLELDEPLDELWPVYFDPLVGGEEALQYIIERTLMRPRDLISFVQHAVDVAINRGQTRVREEDIREAERLYSQQMLVNTSYEIEDTHPELEAVLFAFEGSRERLSLTDCKRALSGARLSGDLDDVVELLVWFGFLGVSTGSSEDPKFSYDVPYSVHQFIRPVKDLRASLVIHPGFRSALGTAA
jgi:hypothetical protein